MNDAPKEESDTLPDQQGEASQQSSPVELPLVGPCGVCGVQTQYRCARCGTAFFCSRAHQRQGWSTTAPVVVTPQEPCTDARSGGGPSAATGPEPFGHSARCIARPQGPLRSAVNNPNLPSWASSSGTTTTTTVGNNNNLLHSRSSKDDLSIGAKLPPPKEELSTVMRHAIEWDASRRGGDSSFLRSSSSGSSAGSGSSTAGSTAGLPSESSHQVGSTVEPFTASGAASLSPPRNNDNNDKGENKDKNNNGGFGPPMSAFGPLATDPFTTPPRTKNRVTQAASALPEAGGGGHDNALARASSSSLERPAMAPPQVGVGSGSGSGGAMQAAQVQQLMDMGVCPDEAAATKALNRCGGSVEQAVEWLLEGGLDNADNDDKVGGMSGVGNAPPSLSRAVNSMHFDESDFHDVGGGSSYHNHHHSNMSALSVASLAFHDQQTRHRFNNGGGHGTGVGGSGIGGHNGRGGDDDDATDSLGGAGSVGARDGDDCAFGEYDTGAHWTEGNSGAASNSEGASEPPPLPPPQRPGTPDTKYDNLGGGGGGGGGGVKNDKKRSHSHASWVDDSCFVAEFPLTVTRGISSGPPWHRSLLLYVYRVQSTSTDDATTAASMSANAAASSTGDLSDLLFVIDELPLGSNVVGSGARSSGESMSHGGIDALAPSGGGAAVPPSEGVRRLALLLNQREVATLSRVHLPGTRQPSDWAPSQGTTWLSPTNIRPLAHTLASTFLEARPDSVASFASTPSSSSSSCSVPHTSTIGQGDRPPVGSNDALRMQYVLCVPNTGRIVARSVQVCTNQHGSSQTAEDMGVDFGTNSSAAACYEAARNAMFAQSDDDEEEEESTVFELASQQRANPFSFSQDDIEGFGDVASSSSSSALRENHFRPVDSEDPFREVHFDPAMARYLEMRRGEMVNSVFGGGVDGLGETQGTQAPRRRLPSPPPQVVDEEKVGMLLAMGFPDELARATLLEHRNDLEAAAEALLG